MKPSSRWNFLAPVLLNNRYPALHGFRVIIFLMVIIYHFNQRFSPFFNGVWFLLDSLFVLTGFLISLILLHAIDRKGSGIWRFYLRRSLRIFPAYYFVLIGYVLIFGLGEVSVAEFWREMFYLTNYAMDQPRLMSWSWSLCMDEHFYLLCPFVIIMLKNLPSHKSRLLALVAIWFSALPLRIWILSTFGEVDMERQFYAQIFYPTHTRYDELFSGIIAGYLLFYFQPELQKAFNRPGVKLWQIPPLVACAVVLYLFRYVSPVSNPMIFKLGAAGFATAASIFFAVIILALVSTNNFVVRSMGHRWFLFVASITYPVYLVHQYVFGKFSRDFVGWLDTIVGGDTSVLSRFIAFIVLTGLATAIGYVIHIVVEKPLLIWRDNSDVRQLALSGKKESANRPPN